MQNNNVIEFNELSLQQRIAVEFRRFAAHMTESIQSFKTESGEYVSVHRYGDQVDVSGPSVSGDDWEYLKWKTGQFDEDTYKYLRQMVPQALENRKVRKYLRIVG